LDEKPCQATRDSVLVLDPGFVPEASDGVGLGDEVPGGTHSVRAGAGDPHIICRKSCCLDYMMASRHILIMISANGIFNMALRCGAHDYI